jgi:hypothetical protein
MTEQQLRDLQIGQKVHCSVCNRTFPVAKILEVEGRYKGKIICERDTDGDPATWWFHRHAPEDCELAG